MNEAFRPDDVTQRSAPGPLKPPAVETAPPRRRNWLMWIVIVAALAAAAWFGWKKYETAATSPKQEQASGRPPQPPQTVRVAPVMTGDMPLTIDALGTVTPFETVTIRTQIAGMLQHVGFTEGQTVKQGDFIAQIDPRPYEAALAQAQGQLAKDQALLGQAQGDLARYQQLAKQDSISQQQVTDQMSLVAQDKAAIAADQAMVKTAELNVAYAHIVSPVTGRAGLNSSIRETTCSPPTPPASSSSRKSIRSASCSRRPRAICSASRRGSTPGPSFRSRCSTGTMFMLWQPGR